MRPLIRILCLSLFLFPSLSSAQLTPLNFVYTGVGGQTDALKFTYQEGFFKKHGVDPTMIYVTSGVITAQTVVSGTAPMANTNGTDALRAIAAGAPMKIIMVNIDQFFHLFVVRPGINSPKDMKGKRVAVSRYGSFSDIQTRFLVRQWGLDPDKDVQTLQIGNSAARAAALFSGGVDGAIVTPGFVPAAKKAGLSVLFDLSTMEAKFANQILVANDRIIKEQPRVVKGVTMALVEGVRYFKANPTAAKAYLKKAYKGSDAEIESIYAETNRFVRSEPTPDLEGIQNAWDSMPDLKARGDLDLKKFIDGRFVAEALKETK